jgi:AAA domain
MLMLLQPTSETYTGDDPVGYLIGRHLFRGPLSESQRAMAAARAANLQLGDNQHSKGVPIGRASELLNVGRRSVDRSRFVLRQGSPDLIASVDADRITLHAAETECRCRARQASKERIAATISAEASPQAEFETNSTSKSTTSAPEADDRASQAETDVSNVLSEPQDAAQATMEPTGWVWPEHIPSAGVTAVVGRSTLVTVVAAKLAATIAAGTRFPDDDKVDSGKVLWATTNPSSQAVRDCVYLSAEPMTLSSPGVDFLGPESDEVGLPIRHLSADLQRIRHKVSCLAHVTLVVIDYLSDYLAHGALEGEIERLGPALSALQAFAIEYGTAVLLPMCLPCRRQTDFDMATQLLARSSGINSVLVIERDIGSASGTLTKLNRGADRLARAYRFHVRQKWNFYDEKVPVIEWDFSGSDTTQSAF